MKEEEKIQELDEVIVELINNITKEEILEVLSSYETKSKASFMGIFAGGLIGGFAICGGLGTLITSVIGSLGLTFIGLATAGIGLGVAFGGSLIMAFLGKYFEEKSKDRSDYNEINEIEKKIRNPVTLEYKIFKNFHQNFENYIIQNLIPLIENEYNGLKNIAQTIELDNEDFLDKIGEILLKKTKEDIPDFHISDKFSILVLGKTGVGKTTLINSILNQEQKGVGIGKPIQMQKTFEKQSNHNLFEGLDIWDSRGIELAKEFSIQNYSEEVFNFIQNFNENKLENGEKLKNSLNFIHCIWYCITGSRIEPSELEYIKKLKSIYSSDKKLPIIFVFTQADNNKEFIESIKNEIIEELNDPNITFIPVISKNTKFEVEEIVFLRGKKGLQLLMEKSLNLSKQGFESAFYGNIQKQFKNILLYFLSKKPFIKSLENIQKNITSLNSEKKIKKIKQLYEKFPDLLFDSLSDIYFNKQTFKNNKSRNKNLLDEWKIIFIELYNQKNKNFINLINKETLKSFIEDSINNYYKEEFQNKISEIKDYELMTVHDKNKHEIQIKKSLDPKINELKKVLIKIIDNYVAHKEELITHFILLYLSKDFFDIISKRLERSALLCFDKMKNTINNYVQEVAQKIYNDLSKKINIEKIPKDEKTTKL